MNINHLKSKWSPLNQQTIDLMIPDILFHPFCSSFKTNNKFFYESEGKVVPETIKLFYDSQEGELYD